MTNKNLTYLQTGLEKARAFAQFCQNLFNYFAVEICHRNTLLSATQGFLIGKNFANRQKLQRRHSALKNSSQRIGITAVTVNACQ